MQFHWDLQTGTERRDCFFWLRGGSDIVLPPIMCPVMAATLDTGCEFFLDGTKIAWCNEPPVATANCKT